MTQPQSPSPSYYPQQPSAVPAPGQAYQAQASAASAPMAGQAYQAQPSAASAPMAGQAYQAPGAQGQPYPPQPAGDSFFGSLFDTSKGFVARYGNIVFIVAVVAICLGWGYEAYTVGNETRNLTINQNSLEPSYNTTQFLLSLLLQAPWNVSLIFLVRLFIEFVRGSVRPGAGS